MRGLFGVGTQADAGRPARKHKAASVPTTRVLRAITSE
jgi:hypothetical protein